MYHSLKAKLFNFSVYCRNIYTEILTTLTLLMKYKISFMFHKIIVFNLCFSMHRPLDSFKLFQVTCIKLWPCHSQKWLTYFSKVNKILLSLSLRYITSFLASLLFEFVHILYKRYYSTLDGLAKLKL